MVDLTKFLFVIFPIFLFSNTINAQEYALKLEKIRNREVKKTKIFKEGTLLVIHTNNGRHKGVFAVMDSTSIILESGEIIRLEDIKKFRSPNGKLFGGLTLTIVGGLSFWGGLIVSGLEDAFSQNDNSISEITAVSGLIAFVSGILILSNYNEKPSWPNWKISIIQSE